MAQILVRDIEEDVKLRLQRRAARHGRSMEAELRDILRAAADGDRPAEGLGSEMEALFSGVGFKGDERVVELRGGRLGNPFEE